MKQLWLALLPVVLLACGPADDETDTAHSTHTTHTTTTTTTSNTSTATTTTSATTPVVTGECQDTHTLTSPVLNTETDWTYYDLDSASEVSEADGWDLRMSTWTVETNGGVTGSGGVEIAAVLGALSQFDDLCQAPDTGFAADSEAGAGFAEWYLYDFTDHTLSVADFVYFVKTSEGAYQRLRFDGYYEGNGDVHTPGFTHGPIEAP